MKNTFKWLLNTLLVTSILALPACGGGGGGGIEIASDCAGNSDSFICDVYKVVNNMTSETADPRETDSLIATTPENVEPTTNI